ncbi:unnamed protein product [Angiostrongylus costaricensis]|uniref:MYND-type domain-containing protein n=1 Tax=Angiostrongylus costaricensis TaxID=334426 RepID=A0A0R3PNM9_ANGCS|nr:unnamed protein product [Angiostrongylus costaricensis]
MMNYEEDFAEEVFCFALAPNYLLSYCHGCLKDGSELKKCTGCRMFVYCSTDCQKKDWRMHKVECASCKACQFLEDFKVFFDKQVVKDYVIKRLCKVVCVNSFSLTNQYSVSIGISLCIRLSAIDHSCRPNVRYAYRMTTAVMVPTLCSRAPISLNDARHSYINELLPKSLRQEILKRDYNFDCECEGCLDDERNDRMEAWYCINCQDGWLAPREDAKCTSCNWTIDVDHFELCRVAVESALAGNKVLESGSYKLESKVLLANKLVSVFKETLHEFNVLRIPSLRILYENAIAEKRTMDMLTFGSELLRVQSQFQDEDDLAICHLKYGLAQAYKSVGSDDDCRKMLSGVPEAIYFSLFL